MSSKPKRETAEEQGPEYLAAIAHELRNGLGGLLGVSELLLATELDERQRELVGSIRDCGDGLLKLVRDVLDFGNLDGGMFQLENAPFDPIDTIHHVQRVMGPRATAKGLVFETRVGAGVPVAAVGDRDRICQVLFNLIGNAVKFTDGGHIWLEVNGRNLGAAFELTVEVTDTGCGIATEDLDKVFLPARQTAEGRRRGGAGLGLAITRALVERMGGSLEVESDPGLGSRFRFAVRLRRAEPPPLPPRRDEAGLAAPGLQVLVADDNAINRELLETMLRHLGHRVHSVADGEAAVARAGRIPYDLILMDIRMPGLDGIAATRAIRSRDGARPVILGISGHDSATHGEAFRAAGMDGMLSKPLHLAELAAVITDLAPVLAARNGEPAPDPGPASPDSPLWPVLERIRALGGAPSRD
ncbi:MAG: ATP-binding protein [Pseudomonadota bacterium]|nr:ATP-binding protein [Pseudomonadota bacterium]